MSRGENANTWNDFLHREFQNESDRAAVILTASLLDSALHSLLKTYLAPSVSNDDDLFDGANAPIGTFSAKIQLAYRLGLISIEFARDLNLIRRIRNDFAHNIQQCSFNSPAVQQRVTQLCMSSRMIEKDPWVREGFPPGTRGDFVTVSSWMLYLINCLAEEVVPIVPAEREFHYTEVGDIEDPRHPENPINKETNEISSQSETAEEK